VQWNGFIVAPKSGTYKLEAKADDEMKVLIDGKVIINLNFTAPDNEAEVMGASTDASKDGSVKLKAGEAYPIEIRFKEKKQNASVSLYWTFGNGEKQVVPASAFFTDKTLSDSGLKGIYSSMKTHLCYTQNKGNLYAISFEWPENSLELEVPEPDKRAEVRMLGLHKKLNWTYLNGKLIIDTSTIGFNDLPSYDAWTFEIKTKTNNN
jgi:hypothetical protein